MEPYKSLHIVLSRAEEEARSGKGHERHADGRPFEEQISCWLERRGYDYARGQAVKKIDESLRLSPERAIKELLGAINFCAIAIIAIQEGLVADPNGCQNTYQTKMMGPSVEG
jgi:hypothetical protein